MDSKLRVLQPDVSGQAEVSDEIEMTPEQKAERRQFLELKLADLKARQETVEAELESLT